MNLPKNKLTNEKIDKSLLNLFHKYDSAHSLVMINAVNESIFEIELGKKEFKKSILNLIHQAEITARIDEWKLISETVHSAGITSELYVNDYREKRLSALEKEIE